MNTIKYCLRPGCKNTKQGCLYYKCQFRYLEFNDENINKIATLINEVQVVIDMLPPYDDSDWKDQPDNLKLDVSAAKSSLMKAIKNLGCKP